MQRREPGRYEITFVPATVRNRDRALGRRQTVMPRYERATFEREQMRVPGKLPAELICPGHPLLTATMDLILERYRELLRQGTVLADERDAGEEPRALLFLEHAIQEGRRDPSGQRRIASRRLQFVEVLRDGSFRHAGYAPFLDYRPLSQEELERVSPCLGEGWLSSSLEQGAVSYAVEHLVPEHLEEVRAQRGELVSRTMAAVKERLTREIAYWDHRAEELRAQEQAGKPNAKINSARAQARADELQRRLAKREEELLLERQIAPLPPAVIGGALVVPAGLLERLRGQAAVPETGPTLETEQVERLAMRAVMEAETRLGREARDVSVEQTGWDIESRDPASGTLRFIEVKGRAAGKATVTITKNEIIQALHNPKTYLLAVVLVDPNGARPPRYIRTPFRKEPDFGVTSVTYDLQKLLRVSEEPG